VNKKNHQKKVVFGFSLFVISSDVHAVSHTHTAVHTYTRLDSVMAEADGEKDQSPLEGV